ncbi:hypothetical protein HOH87_07100 [bacterium]|jgi:hypothetical protein|nr:hypothetical protein [bacterium]
MSSYEERVADLEVSTLTDQKERVDKLRKNSYYQQLQKGIADKREVGKQVSKKEDVNQVRHQKHKPQLRSSFKWGKDKKGEYILRPEAKKHIKSPRLAVKSADHIANFLGYKIDLSGKTSELMGRYQTLYVEARSHNYLMARFAELKFGMVSMILSLLGVSTDELKGLQKKALKEALKENEVLFAQNEYNVELMTIFNMGRDTGRLMVLQETAKQLVEQMEKLGGKGYYSKERIFEIKREQVQKILQELIQEKQNLEFLRDFQ